MTNFI